MHVLVPENPNRQIPAFLELRPRGRQADHPATRANGWPRDHPLPGNGQLGCYPAPYFLSGYIYLEARSDTSLIEIGDGVWMNNCVVLTSDGPGIFIGRRTMLGTYCEIIDSDFHDLHPDRRADGVARTGKVVIGENVLIGSNVKILKGVKIGDNAVIANGSVVTRSVPANAIVFGNPARAGMGLVQE